MFYTNELNACVLRIPWWSVITHTNYPYPFISGPFHFKSIGPPVTKPQQAHIAILGIMRWLMMFSNSFKRNTPSQWGIFPYQNDMFAVKMVEVIERTRIGLQRDGQKENQPFINTFMEQIYWKLHNRITTKLKHERLPNSYIFRFHSYIIICMDMFW